MVLRTNLSKHVQTIRRCVGKPRFYPKACWKNKQKLQHRSDARSIWQMTEITLGSNFLLQSHLMQLKNFTNCISAKLEQTWHLDLLGQIRYFCVFDPLKMVVLSSRLVHYLMPLHQILQKEGFFVCKNKHSHNSEWASLCGLKSLKKQNNLRRKLG